MRGALGAVVLLVAGCRSPFADWEESGPPEDPQKVGVGVHGWPFFERDPNRAGVRTDVLWPLSSVRTSPDGELRRASFLVPIVLVEKDGTRRRFGVRPLFDVETDSNPDARVEDVDLLFPIVKWREAPDESRFEVRPLWWSGHEGDEDWTVFVPFFGDWDLDGRSGWFAGPLAGSVTDGTETWDWWAAGLAMHGSDPSRSMEGTRVLLGAIESSTWDDGASWRVFPFVTAERDRSKELDEMFFVWPGLAGWKDRGDAHTQWAFPVWFHHLEEEGDEGRADDEWTVVFPFWWSHEDADGWARVLVPVYGAQKEKDFERTYWGGLLLVTTDGPTKRATDVVWPVFHYGEEGDAWDARLFPVLWLGADGDDSSYTHVWPLFGTKRDGTHSQFSVAWPFFTYDTYDDGWELDFPAPFVSFDRRGTSHSTTIFPLVHTESDSEQRSYEGNVLGLLANWEGDENWEGEGRGKSDFRILWRLVQDTDTGDRHVFAFNPFFRHETNARGDDHWSALFGLVGRTREAEDVRWRLFWFLEF
jgi:hypothetical protein